VTKEEQVIAWLAQQDVKVYLVGGCVRDRLLNRPLYDLDVAVAGDGLSLARRLANRFRGAYYALDEARSTGRSILSGEEGQDLIVDVARLRGSDPLDMDPEVQGLVADLSDRDFTINALAADVRSPGDVIDHHDGLADLAAGIIRPVSEDIIRNDPLRALRAVRLAAALDFRLARETEGLIRRDGAELAHVSGERVRDELARLLARPQAALYLDQLDALGLLTVILPELEPLRGLVQSPPHHLDAFTHSLETVRALEALLGEQPRSSGKPPALSTVQRAPDTRLPEELRPFAEQLRGHLGQIMGDDRPRLVTLKLAALLHDAAKAAARSVDENGRIRFFGHQEEGVQITGRVLRRLRFNKSEMRLAENIVRHHMRPMLLASQESVSSRAVYRFFRDTGEAGVDVLLHALADYLAKRAPDAAGVWDLEALTDSVEPLQKDRWPRLVALTARMLTDYWKRGGERVAPPSLIGGNDLLREFGLQPGPQIGELLEMVREAQVSGEVHTAEEALALIRTHLAGSR
jgi:poly(A) polymerase/tRNA nucleotidyltransferase (CCA-adding enzyme)